VRISREVARRFLLGRQGLWPGRRWRGLAGTERAMRAMENLQLDPLQIVARAHDLALASRVIGYRQDDWRTLTYDRRRFFEWGGWLAIRPMDELPNYRVLMRRERTQPWNQTTAAWHGPAIDEMRAILRERGEVTNRDFAIGDRARVDSYRGRKDSSVALHYLWRTGEAMTLRRDRFERVYAPVEVVAPATLLEEVSDEEAEDFLLLKRIAEAGFTRLIGIRRLLLRDITAREIAAWRDRKIADGTLIELEVEGLERQRNVALALDAPVLEALSAGKVPRAWKPLETTTDAEATFLSPLDPVMHDRDRTRALFDFDYLWEVYTKVEKRQFGYYALPIVWGDRIVGRFDATLDRPTTTLVINGLWLEDEGLGVDQAFAEAMGRGMARFLEFLGATTLDPRHVLQQLIRSRLASAT
jgi:uncharacterized protein